MCLINGFPPVGFQKDILIEQDCNFLQVTADGYLIFKQRIQYDHI